LTFAGFGRIKSVQMNRSTFEELLRTAQRAGIEVRHAALGGAGGGLASVRGRRLLVVDTDADPEDQLDRTIAALRRVPEFLTQPLRPDVQQLLSKG
jgi:hypothetical protein